MKRIRLKLVTVCAVVLLMVGAVVANVSFADSTSLILDNTTDPSEKTDYRIGEAISPRAFFQLSDASNQCLRLNLEIDKEAVKQGYVLIADGGATWLDLANAEKMINYTSADKLEDRYRMEYEFVGLKAGSQVAIPFPFKTSPSTPPGTKINTIAKLYTCSGVLLNTANKEYTVNNELVIGKDASLYVNGYPEDAANTVRWTSAAAIEFNKPNNLVPTTEKCVYAMKYGYSSWNANAEAGVVNDPDLRIVARIPAGATLLPEADNPGWTYDLTNNLAYFIKKAGDEGYISGTKALYFSCSGMTLPDSKQFHVDLQIAMPGSAPDGPWSTAKSHSYTVSYKNIAEKFGIKKESFTNLEQERGRTTEIFYYDRGNYRLKRTDASGKSTYKIVPINPSGDIFGEDNVNRWRLTAYNYGKETIKVNNLGEGTSNTNEDDVIAFRIDYANSTPALIERMKTTGRFDYYSASDNQRCHRIPDSGEVVFTDVDPQTWFNLGGCTNNDYFDFLPGEKFVFEVVTKKNKTGIDSIDNGYSTYSNYINVNFAYFSWYNPVTQQRETLSRQATYDIRYESQLINVNAGNDNILSYTQCEKHLPAGQNPSWLNCGRYSIYSMGILGSQEFMANKLSAGKLVSVTLLPRGIEYVRELNIFEGPYRADGVARGAVTTRIVPNYKGTGQQAIVREWDMDYLKQIYDGKRNVLQAPIELEAKSFTKAGNNEVKTYWYPKDDPTIKLTQWNQESRILEDPNGKWVNYFPNKKGYEVDSLNIAPSRSSIYQTTTIYNFNPPAVGSVYKLVSSNSDPNVSIGNKSYGTYSEPTENNGEIYYKIGLAGGPTPLSTFDVIDVLPTHPNCDYNIADLKGEFGKRTWKNPGASGQAGRTNECSAFATPLKTNPELISENTNALKLFNVKYSTEVAPSPVTSTDNLATKTWNWKTANQITDWSKVTAYMLSLKPGMSVAKNQELDFYTRNYAKAGSETFDQSLSVNQAALSTIDPLAYRRTIDDWVRSNDARSVIRVYRLHGNVFNDLDRNTHKDPEDINLQGYAVTVKDSTGKTIATTTTDAKGNWSYLPKTGGNYTVEVIRKDSDKEYFSYDQSGKLPVSQEGDIYSTTDKNGKQTVTLTLENREARVDTGIYRYQVNVNTSVVRWDKPSYAWTIKNEVLDDNDPKKTYVSSDTRETRRIPSDNSKLNLPLNYRLSVTAQKTGSVFSKLQGTATIVNQLPTPITTTDQDGMVFSMSPAARDAFDCIFDGQVNNVTISGQNSSVPGSGIQTVLFTCTLKSGKTLPAEKDFRISVLPKWKSGVYLQDLKPATNYGLTLEEVSTVKIRDKVTVGNTASGDLSEVTFKYTYKGTENTVALKDVLLDGASVVADGKKVTLVADLSATQYPWKYWPTLAEKTKTIHTDAYLIDGSTGTGGTEVAVTPVSRATVVTNVVAAITPIYVHKVGELNAERSIRKDLPGAEFQLYNSTAAGGLGTPVAGAVKPVNAGETMPGTAFIFKVSNLEIGKKYFLVETKAPSGYNLIPQPVAFTVGDDGTVDVSMNDQNSIYLSVKDYTGAGIDPNSPLPPKELVIYDAPVALLPFSGGSGIYLWGLLGGIVLALSARALNRAIYTL